MFLLHARFRTGKSTEAESRFLVPRARREEWGVTEMRCVYGMVRKFENCRPMAARLFI
jgi:hypothetical protein